MRAAELPGARAVLRDLEPLCFSDGGDPIADYVSQVRAGSAVGRWGERLVIVQTT